METAPRVSFTLCLSFGIGSLTYIEALWARHTWEAHLTTPTRQSDLACCAHANATGKAVHG